MAKFVFNYAVAVDLLMSATLYGFPIILLAINIHYGRKIDIGAKMNKHVSTEASTAPPSF